MIGFKIAAVNILGDYTQAINFKISHIFNTCLFLPKLKNMKSKLKSFSNMVANFKMYLGDSCTLLCLWILRKMLRLFYTFLYLFWFRGCTQSNVRLNLHLRYLWSWTPWVLQRRLHWELHLLFTKRWDRVRDPHFLKWGFLVNFYSAHLLNEVR